MPLVETIYLKSAHSKYSALNILLHRIGSSRAGSWFASRTLPYLDRFLFNATRGHSTPTRLLGGVPVVMLTTVGARTGVKRTVPLLYVADSQNPAAIAVVASNWGQRHHPAWYYNLRANPRATCAFPGHASEYIAHEASGAEYDRLWQRFAALYRGYALYKQRARGRQIPIMVMEPVQ